MTVYFILGGGKGSRERVRGGRDETTVDFVEEGKEKEKGKGERGSG